MMGARHYGSNLQPRLQPVRYLGTWPPVETGCGLPERRDRQRRLVRP